MRQRFRAHLIHSYVMTPARVSDSGGATGVGRGLTTLLALAAAATLAVPGVALGAANSTTGFSFLCSGRTVLNKCPQSTYTKGKLNVHTHTNYTTPGNGTPGGATRRIQLFFDNDFQFNPGVAPRCDPNLLFNRDMSAAMTNCGSSLIGTGRGQAVAGSPPFTVNACLLLFNAPNDQDGDPTIALYARAQVTNPSNITCADPASNTQGNATIVLVGTLRWAPVPDYGRELDIPNIDSNSILPVSDLNFSLQKNTATSGYVKARCLDANHVWNATGFFTYNNNATQTINSTKTCTVG
jgi:hypothetical protein